MAEGVTPTRGESHTFKVPEERLTEDLGATLQELSQKLMAEDRRLRKLLPDPPAGQVWVPCVQRQGDDGFTTNTINFRIVYKLKVGF